jgi:dipeptidyl aminopeptidase/acylaminoacyl peptidase
MAKVRRANPDLPPSACVPRDRQLAQLFEPYVDAFSSIGLELSPDGKTLLFLSDRGGGSYQLYVAPVDKPAAPPTAIAPAKDGVADACFSPDGLYILFTRDKDKNENTQLFRATPDGKDVMALSKAPDRFHNLPRVSPDWKTLVYLRGVHKTGGVALVTQPIEGGEAKKVMTAKGFHALSDLSPDGSHALVFNLLSPSRSRLMSVDLKTGNTTGLAPSKGTPAHAHRSAFSPDGKSVYVVTDEGMERAGVRKIDARTGAVQASFGDREGEAADLVAARGQPLVAVVVDFGNHQTLRILDGQTLKDKARVKLPLGRVRLGQFSADGTGLVFSVATPSTPSDVYVLSSASGRFKLLRRDNRPTLRKVAPLEVKLEKVPSFDKVPVPVNIYLPKKLPRGKKLPTIVSVHGGPAASSYATWNPMNAFWVSRGFVVVEPNVRGSTGFGKAYERADNGRKRMDAVRDVQAVNQWLRQQPWADPDRLVIFGGSYGGYMTYMALGHQPTLWRAGIGLVGVVNLITFLKNTSGAIRLAFREEFGQLETDGPFLKEVSPIAAVKQMRAPLFVYQGENDPRVPRTEQDQLVLALRKRHVSVEYLVAADEGHSLSQRHNKLAFVSRATRFLEQHIGLPGPPEGCASSEGKKGREEKKAPEGKSPAKKAVKEKAVKKKAAE